jgi:hypothetical protein
VDTDFLRRTYRSALIVTAFVLLTLTAYGLYWALWPLIGGAGLSLSLLVAGEAVVRRVFTPERAMAERKGRRSGGGARAASGLLLGLALVKYPLVALLVWMVVRWSEMRQVMVFAGGFALIHMVIGLRALSRHLVVDRMQEKKTAAGGGGGETR